MLQTLEVRWFGDRPLADVDSEWFESLAGENFRRYEERTDRYIVLPGVADIGLKFRGEAGVDFKALTEEIGLVEMRLSEATIAAGWVESWAKWSYGGPEYMALGAVLSRLDVVEVAKRRWRYLFDLGEPVSDAEESTEEDGDTPRQEPAMVDLDADPQPQIERGLAFELAEVECRGKKAWTLGLEGFPSSPDLGSDMLSAAMPALSSCPLELSMENSNGYPAWLESLGAS